MKKNLISVLILALVLANLILSAILTFTVLPQAKRSNELINQVCSAIDLELASGDNAVSDIPIENIEIYNITGTFTINLRADGDGKEHYAIFTMGLSMNIESDGYKDGGAETLLAKETLIKDNINTIVQGYTAEEFKADSNSAVKAEILRAMQNMFGSDFIVDVSFSSVNTQ